MCTLKEMGKRIKSVKLEKVIPKMIVDEKKLALDLNRFDQLAKGKNSDGEDGENLRGYKSLEYAIVKNKMNPQPGFGIPDLKLTGDFYNGFDLKADAKTYTIYSNDSKSDSLEAANRYSVYIFGLNNKNKRLFAQQIYENRLLPYVKKQLFNK